jgi:hypothetical protein
MPCVSRCSRRPESPQTSASGSWGYLAKHEVGNAAGTALKSYYFYWKYRPLFSPIIDEKDKPAILTIPLLGLTQLMSSGDRNLLVIQHTYDYHPMFILVRLA